MRSGVSFPAFGASATFALAAGTPDADYPVANLADLSSIRTVAKSSGVTAITIVFAADQAVQMVAVLHHNALSTSTMRIRLYSDAGMTSVVDDSTAFSPNTGGLYPACTPYVLAAPVAARAVRIDLTSHTWQIGAIEVAGFWGFTDVDVAREFGLNNRDSVTSLTDGADHATKAWSPRTLTATREVIDLRDEGNIALDFQLEKGTARPFVWVWDADDPATWDRECFVVRQTPMSTLEKLSHPSGRVSFKLQEHLA